MTSASESGSAVVYTLRKAVAWALGLVLLAGTAGALGIVLYPVVTDGQALTVLSGSMRPGLPVGAMVFTRAVDPADVRVGDVITFQRPSNPAELVTHRIVAVDRSGPQPVFRTKGDANNAEDIDPLPAANVRGKLWFSLSQAGRLAAILHSPKGLGVLIVLICAVVAVSPGPRRKPEAPATDDEARRTDDEPRRTNDHPRRTDDQLPRENPERRRHVDEGTVFIPASHRPAVPPPPPSVVHSSR